METIVVKIKGLRSAACVSSIEHKLEQLEYVVFQITRVNGFRYAVFLSITPISWVLSVVTCHYSTTISLTAVTAAN